MLAMSDVSLSQFIPVFANTGAKVAFLVPTPTGYIKSIMDAIGDVRLFLLEAGIHNYETQKQGPENKVKITSYFVYEDHLEETCASLYRPVTKKGDPRIWFYNLKSYCQPCNLLALISFDKKIYVLNLSKTEISNSLFRKSGMAYDIVMQSVYNDFAISEELIQKIWWIHKKGFIPSITSGDPGVGDTLEHALGIKRNNSELPDYKGIELKASRLTRRNASGSRRRTNNRVNLFSKVPDEGLSYSEIVKQYGRWTHNDTKNEDRLSIQNTTFASKANSFGLVIMVDNNNEQVNICHQDEMMRKRILSYWYFSTLKSKLLEKHRETFWVKAVSEMRNGIEWFRYDVIQHTKNPNTSLILPLIETDRIMIDFAGYYKKTIKNGEEKLKWRDHGLLFKMWPDDLPLLFGEPVEYILEEMDFENGTNYTKW